MEQRESGTTDVQPGQQRLQCAQLVVVAGSWLGEGLGMEMPPVSSNPNQQRMVRVFVQS